MLKRVLVVCLLVVWGAGCGSDAVVVPDAQPNHDAEPALPSDASPPADAMVQRLDCETATVEQPSLIRIGTGLRAMVHDRDYVYVMRSYDSPSVSGHVETQIPGTA